MDPRRRTPAGDHGVISLFVAVLFVAFLLVAGIVVDSAELRGQRRALSDLARQAARAAVQEVDVTAYRATGTVRLDADAATAAARELAARSGLEAGVAVRGDRATVRLSDSVAVRVLGLGERRVSVSAAGEARATWGVGAGR
jgi:Flp pilus assembly protein TadG